MVSKSCIKLIDLYFSTQDAVQIKKTDCGEVELTFDSKQISDFKIKAHFEKLGFAVLTRPNDILVEQIKTAAIELIFLSNNTSSLIRNSDYIQERVQQPYSKISSVFSLETGVTLEKYLILLKIEKTKELLINDEYSLSEISYMLGYSSVQYLSTQFKKITGLTVSQFKKEGHYQKTPLEELV